MTLLFASWKLKANNPDCEILYGKYQKLIIVMSSGYLTNYLIERDYPYSIITKQAHLAHFCFFYLETFPGTRLRSFLGIPSGI